MQKNSLKRYEDTTTTYITACEYVSHTQIVSDHAVLRTVMNGRNESLTVEVEITRESNSVTC
jgi:hypothetical protein